MELTNLVRLLEDKDIRNLEVAIVNKQEDCIEEMYKDGYPRFNSRANYLALQDALEIVQAEIEDRKEFNEFWR